jgi:thiamine biosynthesis lipoprotein
MNRKHRRIAIEIVIGLCLIAAARIAFRSQEDSLWPRRRISIDSSYRTVMGTFARTVAVAADPTIARKSIEAAFAELENVDNLMSDYKDDSQISRVNRDAYNQPVRVGESTFEVLQRARHFSKLTNGAFDVTVGPLVDLWRTAAEQNRTPTETELATARSKVGYEKLTLDADKMTVRFAAEGMRLDLGGIGKGYAIDKAIEAMQKSGAIGGMVDVGGDVRCFSAPPPGKDTWLIGLQNPAKTKDWLGTGTPLMILKIIDGAVTTSGDYRRFALIEGKKYSHILNRATGRGTGEPSSVTIIAKTAIDADALATAVTVLGPEKGLALIETLPDTEAILISPAPDFEITKTKAADKYMK